MRTGLIVSLAWRRIIYCTSYIYIKIGFKIIKTKHTFKQTLIKQI